MKAITLSSKWMKISSVVKILFDEVGLIASRFKRHSHKLIYYVVGQVDHCVGPVPLS
jgi:hypothetical protein